MFRFSIRELMLVTAVVAFGLGWWQERCKQQSTEEWREFAEWQRDRLALLVESHGHKVTFYDGWKVDLDSSSIFGGESIETLREVPHSWR